MQIKLVILDFDGVIVESNDIKDKAFRQLFGRYPGQYEEVMQYHRTNISVSRCSPLFAVVGLMTNNMLHITQHADKINHTGF